MSSIEHIMYRHAFKSGWSGVSRFAQGTSVRDVKNLVSAALRNGTISQKKSGFDVVYNAGRTIGTDTNGIGTTFLKVHVNGQGIIRSAYPF